MTAPGRYCLAVCYCRECDHYVPPAEAKVPQPKTHKGAKPDTWTTREDATWIDQL